MNEYTRCYKFLARYENRLLPQFADRWSRFPQGGAAAIILHALRESMERWEQRGGDDGVYDDVVAEYANTINVIERRMQ